MDMQTNAAALPLRAVQLLGRWNRYTQAFTPFRGGCSCCVNAGIQSVQELEASLICHLSDKRTGDATIAAALREGAGYEPGKDGSVVTLLQAIARRTMTASADTLGILLDDIEAALDNAEASQPQSSATQTHSSATT
jgi:hypothetical protein